MEFRNAELGDLSALNAISIKSKSHWGYPQEWIDNWLDELTLDEKKLAEQNVLVLELNRRIIGFSSLVENQNDYEILHLWILPEFIGQGFGKSLLQSTLEKFTQGDKDVLVEADPNAEAFYVSQGFKTFAKVESYPKGRFLPVMRLVRRL